MMKRRDFLRATLVTAGSAVVPIACSESQVDIGACDVEEGGAFFPQSVASGDPRSDSVVLWTRVQDGDATSDLTVTLVVALDEGLTKLVELSQEADGVLTAGAGGTRVVITAQAKFDHCVKVKVAGLDAGTTYYYRFYYAKGTGCYGSRVGRTRTAAAPDADVPVRFPFVSCQDYNGRYYNAYALLAKEELDFVVHLGDYIYETDGDPRFQSPKEGREVAFTDTENALELTASDDATYFAAKSLGNYRELYKTYRADRALQRVHELFPMIAIWDDHEFSDDCYGATGSYFDGAQDETDAERRKAANQAWFEYMPVDYPEAPGFAYDNAAEYPNDITIYRDFKFGKHVHLVMTDLRTYRADHLIPEDAFPGKVVANYEKITNLLAQAPEYEDAFATYGSPYFDIDTNTPGNTNYKEVLVRAAPALGLDPAKVSGEVSALVVNELVARINDAAPDAPVPLIPEAELQTMDNGFAYADLGKASFYGAIGSRYLVVKDTFDPVSRIGYQETSKASGTVLGEEQEAWFLQTMKESTSTWKVWGNEYCLSQLAIDLRTFGVPLAFQRRFYINNDAWDGFREERGALLAELATIGNVVAITGDIHAFLAGTPAVNPDDLTQVPPRKIVEFVSSSISTAPLRSLLLSQVNGDPALSVIGAQPIAENIEQYLISQSTKINPYLAFANARDNGFCIAEASATEFVVTMHQLPEAELAVSRYTEPEALNDKVTVTRFKTEAGGSDLFWDDQGTWKKWDPQAVDWA